MGLNQTNTNKSNKNLEDRVFIDIDVRGDGNCFYYAAMSGLIHNILTKKIPEDSPTAEKIREPAGLLDGIIANAEKKYGKEAVRALQIKNKETPPESLDTSFQKLFTLYQHPSKNFDNTQFGLFLTQAVVPALRPEIYKHATGKSNNPAFKEACMAELIDEKYPAPARAATEEENNQYIKNRNIYSQELQEKNETEFAKIYEDTLKKHNDPTKPTEQGGVFQIAILKDMLDINLNEFQFDDVKEITPDPNKKPHVYIRNTGGHYHVGIPKSNVPEDKKITVWLSNNIQKTASISPANAQNMAKKLEENILKDPVKKTELEHTFKKCFGDKVQIEKNEAEGYYSIIVPNKEPAKSNVEIAKIDSQKVDTTPQWKEYITGSNEQAKNENMAHALLTAYKKIAVEKKICAVVINGMDKSLCDAIRKLAVSPEFKLNIEGEKPLWNIQGNKWDEVAEKSGVLPTPSHSTPAPAPAPERPTPPPLNTSTPSSSSPIPSF